MVGEIVVPGMITIFLGLAAVLVALGYKTGLLEGILSGFTTWFIASLFSIFVIREFVKKLLPGESSFKHIDEDVDAYGCIVEVIKNVTMENNDGRIKFRGTTWQATTTEHLIRTGEKARIVARDNLVWIVESYEDYLLDDIQPASEE